MKSKLLTLVVSMFLSLNLMAKDTLAGYNIKVIEAYNARVVIKSPDGMMSVYKEGDTLLGTQAKIIEILV
jgi:hypothetical protein